MTYENFIIWFLIGFVVWVIDWRYQKTDFAKNFSLYGREVFVMYYHKYVLVPKSLKYNGDDEFASALSLDPYAMRVMKNVERDKYWGRLRRLQDEIGNHGIVKIKDRIEERENAKKKDEC